MPVGGVIVFEGPPPGPGDTLGQIDPRLDMVPRYRQQHAGPPLEMGRAPWVDVRSVNLEYHVRHTALASPGDLEQLKLLTARIFSQRLDRSKPLWECWFVQGLEDDRFAIISKTHHALVDGISGVDLATVLFDLSPVPPERSDLPEWTPQPEPSQAQLIAEGVKGLVRRPFELGRSTVGVALHPDQALRRVRNAAEGFGEVAWAGLNPAPETPLNVPIGSHRRIVWVQTELDHFKAIKNSLGGTV